MKKHNLISDIIAGLAVSFAAMALGAAFGVMSGRGAFAGMIAAAIIPIFTGIFGGTKLSVSGPTAPMTAVSAVVVAFAYKNFSDNIIAEQFITLVFIILGLLLLIAGFLKTGKFIKYIPKLIILGFMSGIALLIWIDQINLLFFSKAENSLKGNIYLNVSLCLSTVVLIFIVPFLTKITIHPKVRKFIPFTFAAILIMTIFTQFLNINVDKIELSSNIISFKSFFQLLKSYLPGDEIFKLKYILKALPYSLQLLILCYLDSLLTALIIDKITKTQSNYNRELVGQGMANIASAVLMGIPGAQATIRSVLLYKEGGKTRIAPIATGILAFLLLIVFKNYVSYITKAVFIGVLLKVGWDVFEKEFLISYLKNKWYLKKERNLQQLIILYTMLVTALIDLNFAVFSGTAIFFIAKKFLKLKDVEDDLADNI
ncbi:MAG: SulP family inorganic anion transporter [Bacteroidetes bacterium]|nr:SulP family inorganic anion transporter [Bacteroidota bacterium]